MRSGILLFVAAGLVVLGAGPATAHAGLTPSELAPNTSAEAEIVLVHGCGPGGTIPDDDESAIPTTTVTVTVPDGVDLAPQAQDGWAVETQTATDGRVEQIVWETTDPNGTRDAIFLGLEVAVGDLAEGTQLWLPILQDCLEDERLAWTHESVAHAANHFPAMRLTVTADAITTTSGGGGLSTGLIALLSLAVAAVAAGTVMTVTGRR